MKDHTVIIGVALIAIVFIGIRIFAVHEAKVITEKK